MRCLQKLNFWEVQSTIDSTKKKTLSFMQNPVRAFASPIHCWFLMVTFAGSCYRCGFRKLNMMNLDPALSTGSAFKVGLVVQRPRF